MNECDRGGFLLTGDFSHDFVEFARALANIFNRDSLVVAMHTFVFFDGRVNRRPAISDYAELSKELAFSITAQHLCGNNRRGIILFGLSSDEGKQFGVCR